MGVSIESVGLASSALSISTIVLCAARANEPQLKLIWRMLRRQPSTSRFVGVLHGEIAGAVADGAGAAGVEGIVVGDQVLGVEGGGDRRAELLPPRGRTGRRSRRSARRFRAEGTAAPPRASRSITARTCTRKASPVRRIGLGRRHGRRAVLERIEAEQGVGVDGHALDIDRHVDPGRSGTPADRQIAGLLDLVTDSAGVLHRDGGLGDSADHARRCPPPGRRAGAGRSESCRRSSRASPGRKPPPSAGCRYRRRTRR